MSLLKDILTDASGEAYDVVSVLSVASVVQAMALEVFVVLVRHQAFDVQAFGVGMAAVFAAVGVALHLNKEVPKP